MKAEFLAATNSTAHDGAKLANVGYKKNTASPAWKTGLANIGLNVMRFHKLKQLRSALRRS